MANGYQANQERKQLLSSFGKDLARRAKSKCELSGESGVSLVIYEVPPTKNDPSFDRCLFISETTLEQIENPKSLQADQWRILGEQIWSELELVQIMAVRILQYIGKSEHWAQEILDNAYLDDILIEQAQEQPI